ncbi:SH3 domain-containing protein, partial [Oscillibacter sp.]|uniref:SH3 domain-containing protein n=1 Tax=Oscillibacter sp. TaxID=1945593 RepID=UPI002D7FCA02
MRRKIILAGAAAFALAALALTAAYFYIPGGARLVFGEGDIRICLNADGTAELDWPEARPSSRAEPPDGGENAPAGEVAGPRITPVLYDLELTSEDGHIQKLQNHPRILLETCTLPMTIRIRAVAEGKNLLGLFRKLAGQELTAEVGFTNLNAPEAVGTPGPGVLSLSWKLSGQVPGFYKIFSLDQADGVFHQVTSTSAKQISLDVRKEGGALALPSYEHPLEVLVRAAVQGEGYVLCGPASNLIRVERQDLLGDDLNLVCRETEPRVYILEWDETRGERYELQEWSEEGWTLLDTLELAEHFQYDLGRLGSGSRHRFQVVSKSVNGAVLSSEEAEFCASIDPLYATIWPIVDQPFYEKADKESAALGKIPGGTALCVLMEEGDWFRVRYKDQYGWVDSRFCMINLPEYVGDHCSYDIANSYRSIFKVHENPIALITDQVVKGFEHIQEADGEFLVPYLYPCAKKLLSAAQAAEADGYRLKIYEAFRPNEATRFLYDTTAEQLELAALVYSYEDAEGAPLGQDEDPRVLDPVTGWEVDLADGLLIDPETGEKISREDLALREAEEAEETAQEGEAPVVPDPDGQFITPAPQPGDEFPFFTLPEEGEGGGLDPVE